MVREILVLHHSHLDVGYTHSQPIVWEMQREFIDQALDMLAGTKDWPLSSQPKWTCEVTEPLLRWADRAGENDLARFRSFLEEGRIGIWAMQYNTSALCSAEVLGRQLSPLLGLRSRFGAKIRTAIQHDVNGVPWPLADMLIDAGVELLIMAVNVDHGRAVSPRPGVFLWAAPSGRHLMVMNGNAYTMFDQVLRTWDNSVASMKKGLSEYAGHLEQISYPHDFLYLTTTNPPEAWDNSPPNPWVARLIREWNDTVGDPAIRYVTPEDLLDKLKGVPVAALPVLRGDWTDFWTFGCGSTAYETAVSRQARFTLEAADLLWAARTGQEECGAQSGTSSGAQPEGEDRHARRVSENAWSKLALFCEHTWTHWDPRPENPPARAQSQLKGAFAHEARELAEYLLIDELEAFAGGELQSARLTHVLVVNTSSRARSAVVRLPSAWLGAGKHLRAQRFTWAWQRDGREKGAPYGPIDLPPFGWKRIPVAELAPLPSSLSLRQRDGSGNEAFIESPFYTVTYDRSTGQVTGVRDKRLGWEVVAPDGPGFFDMVRERPDPSVDASRDAIYQRDLEKEKLDQSCWKTEWVAEREGPRQTLSCMVSRDEDSITLERSLAGPGVEVLTQRITLRSDSDAIELEATLCKRDCSDPEAVYFAFPVDLPRGWRCHFDTAGVPVELDTEQLPGSCKGWMSVDTAVALHAPGRCVTLVCPDSTLVQPGGFFFGRLLNEVPRGSRPLLLAWPLNNYWNTNFPLSQPGVIRLRYFFLTSGSFDAARSMARAQELIHAPLVHPAFAAEGAAEGGRASNGHTSDGRAPGREGRLLLVDAPPAVLVNHVKRAEDGRGVVVRLINLGTAETVARIRPGSAPAVRGWACGTLEDDRLELPVVNGMALITLPPRLLMLARLC